MSQKIYIITGVSGAGKTTIGKALSLSWDLPFFDADDFHSQENIEKMRCGTPLEDVDRLPWLEKLNTFIKSHLSNNSLILACSALKETYRQVLVKELSNDQIFFLHLQLDEDIVANRLSQRKGHFMDPSLIKSQFDAYEIPSSGFMINANKQVQETINEINEKINKMKNEIGIVGLGVMGTSLARNIAGKGYKLSIFNRFVAHKEENVASKAIAKYAELKDCSGFENLIAFVSSLAKPRKIIIMVDAGKAVDAVINDLLPCLESGDILMDTGNSHYLDTQERQEMLKEKGIFFLGVGVSGGEEGALKGPSIMPGGEIEAYDKVKNFLVAIAAKNADRSVCCNYIGQGGSGHFAKMVHNGIEYGEMQLLAEIYTMMRNDLKLSPLEIASIFEKWNQGPLHSYLLTITIDILKFHEGKKLLLDLIVDNAGSKGTGSWTTIAAAELGVAIPTITAALFARYQSSEMELRNTLSKTYMKTKNVEEISIESIEKVYQICRMINHHQGFELISQASILNKWNINLSELASTWSNGCIIRSKLLTDVKVGFKENDIKVLLLPNIIAYIQENYDHIENVQSFMASSEDGFPCILSSIAYFKYMTTQKCNANIIQAQRDYFGAHTYKRIDDPTQKAHHSNWK